jgi:uncharacterized protein
MNTTQSKLFLKLLVWIVAFIVAMSAINVIEKQLIPKQTVAQTEVQTLPLTAQFEANGRTVKLEVAHTVQERRIGLMNRPRLALDRGMGFAVIPARDVEIWMRQMQFPIDIVFLRNGRIEAIYRRVPPCQTESCPTYRAGTPIDQVIELAAGQSDQLNLKVEQKLPITRTD